MTGTMPASPPPTPFEEYGDGDIRHLVESYPLAWVVPASGGAASQLPLIGIFDAENRMTELIGHFALRNPLGAALAADKRATILFSGPDGYISPQQAGNRQWGPTWNYAQAEISTEISVEPELTEEALRLLIDKVEANSARPWSASELGARYHKMLPLIVGFRAHVKHIRGRFKLGQDEAPETLNTILQNMHNPDLAAWMRRFNPGRVQDLDDKD